MKEHLSVDQELGLLIDSRYPVIYLVSWEEQRVLERIRQIVEDRGKKAFTWSITQGLIALDSEKKQSESEDPVTALDHILKSEEDAVFIFCDFHHFMRGNHPAVIRKLRDVAHSFEDSSKTLILLSPVLEIPTDLEKEITVVDYPLPDEQQLGERLDAILAKVKNNPRITIELDEDAREKLLKAALGLTESETNKVFAKAIVKDGKLDRQDVDHVLKEKEQIIRKSGILQCFASNEHFQDVGGLDDLKLWLRKRADSFSDEARQYGLPEPRGILLIGVPGCGKSLVAKAVAAEWQKPLLQLDIGKIFGGLVGASEENIRRAIRVAESVAPAILWLDEVEKGFASAQGGGDSGVTARVFGTLITWMQEKTKPVFVVATANDVSQLPPEFLRKGRFDEIFFVDLPSELERKDIFRIHLSKRHRNPDLFRVAKFAHETTEFSGAEIEQVIISSLYDAFELKRMAGNEQFDLNEIILKNIKETIPLAAALKTKIHALRQWVSTRARLASSHAIERADDITRDRVASDLQTRLRIALPFRSNERVRTLGQLIDLCERYPDEATKYIYDGRFEGWLRQNDLVGLAEKTGECKKIQDRDLAGRLFLGEVRSYCGEQSAQGH